MRFEASNKAARPAPLRSLSAVVVVLVAATLGGYAAAAPPPQPAPAPQPAPLPEQPETLISSSAATTVGGYGGPYLQAGHVNNRAGLWLGGGGAVLFNHTFSVGGAGFMLVTSAPAIGGAGAREAEMMVGYGGLMLGWRAAPMEVAHPRFEVLLGGGYACWDPPEMGEALQSCGDASAFFVAEPTASLEVNVATFMRISMGLGYRIVAGVNWDQPSNARLGGFTGHLRFDFGKF